MPSPEDMQAAQEPSFEELYEDAPCGYLSLLPDSTIVRANRTLLRALGMDAGAVFGRPLPELLAPGSRIYHATHWGPLLELQDEVREVPLDLVRSDGSRLSALLSAFVTRDADGEVQLVRASLFDASDRRRYERELVAARDAERTVRHLGQRALDGATAEMLVGEATTVLRDALQTIDVSIAVTSGSAGGGSGSSDARIVRLPLGPPDAPVGEILARRSEPFDTAERGLIHAVGLVVGGALRRQRAEALAHHRARHDALTGLPNRLMIEELVEQRLRSPGGDGRCTLGVLDIADFKLINDSRGHRAGDELLRAVARRLCSEAPAGLTVGRLGGDEFAVAGSGLGETELATWVFATLRAPFEIGGLDHAVRANVGTATASSGAAAEDLLLDADIAMYAAKERGAGAHVRYGIEMRERTQERVQTEAELRDALRDGQLCVHYQPVICLSTRRMVSMEALVRWEHPERGLVPPGAFIPVAEESDLICDIGAFVLTEATRQLAQWRAAGVVDPEVSVAVNVSARQFARRSFSDQVCAALRLAGLEAEPHLLGLEVTETMLMDGGVAAEEMFASLSAIGVGLLLDDFGTGLSSLARLKRLPVDTLKIDRAFISEIGQSDEDEAIVDAILAMAAKLGLRVVAEGAETEAQLHLLAALGCERVQGYVFSRPLPAAELAQRLAR